MLKRLLVIFNLFLFSKIWSERHVFIIYYFFLDRNVKDDDFGLYFMDTRARMYSQSDRFGFVQWLQTGSDIKWRHINKANCRSSHIDKKLWVRTYLFMKVSEHKSVEYPWKWLGKLYGHKDRFAPTLSSILIRYAYLTLSTFVETGSVLLCILFSSAFNSMFFWRHGVKNYHFHRR